ncbi:hypothetical protein WCLP8_1100026 [uncultured Gammaproteobacteria bacterium]
MVVAVAETPAGLAAKGRFERQAAAQLWVAAAAGGPVADVAVEHRA